jgi:hypothetical protein
MILTADFFESNPSLYGLGLAALAVMCACICSCLHPSNGWVVARVRSKRD